MAEEAVNAPQRPSDAESGMPESGGQGKVQFLTPEESKERHEKENQIEPPVEPEVVPEGEVNTEEPQEPTEPVTQEEPVVEETPVTPDYSAFSQEIGLEINSDQDIVDALLEYKKLKEHDPLGELPQEVKGLMEFIQSGGNAPDYFRYASLDIDGMSDRDVLYQKFLKDNPSLAGNEEFAKMKFEREVFNAKYALNAPTFEDDEQKAEWERQNASEKSFRDQSLKFDADTARAELREFKDKNLTPPEQSTISDEELANMRLAHEKSVDQTLQSFEGVEIPMGADRSFKLGLNDKTKPTVENWMKEPLSMLMEMGFDEQLNTVDMTKFAPFVALLAEYKNGTLGTKLKDFSLGEHSSDTIAHQNINPSDPQKESTPPPKVEEKRDTLRSVMDQLKT